MTRRLVSSLVAAAALLATLAGATSAQAAACVSNGSGNWGASGTWTSCDADGVPDGDDSAAILAAHTVTVDANRAAASLSMVHSALISLANNATLTVGGTFGATGGVLSGNGTVAVGGAFTKSDVNTLTVQEGADIDMNAASSITGGSITLSDQGGGDPSLQVDAALTITDTASAMPISTFAGGDVPHLKISAAGSLVDEQGGPTTIGAPYDNDGQIRAEDGILTLSGGSAGSSSGGDFIATAADQIHLLSSNTLGTNGSLQGAGTILINFSGTTVGDGADITVSTLTIDGGNLTIFGAGLYAPTTITVTHGMIISSRNTSPATFNAVGGEISGNHTVTPTSFTKTSNGSQFNVAHGADLVIGQAAEITGGSICLVNPGPSGAPTLQLNATLTIAAANTSTSPICGGGPVPLLLIGPNGTLVDQQAGATTIHAAYDNDGEIRAEAGGLSVTAGTAGGQSSGDFVATAGDTLTLGSFGDAVDITTGGSLQGAGEVVIAFSTTTVGDGADVTVSTLTTAGGANLQIAGSGLYTPTTINATSGAITTGRDTSPATLNAAAGQLYGGHTVTPTTFTKSTGSAFTIGEGAELVLNGTASFTGGSICLTDAGGGNPSLRINTTFTLPAGVATPLNCNQGADDAAHVIVGTGGLLSRGGAGTSTINTRTLVSGGSIPVANGQTLGFGTLGVSSGSATVAAGGTLNASSVAVSGGTLDVDGALGAPVTLSGGVLTGIGSMTGALTNAGGTIRPGASPGTLTVTGAFTQSSGTLEVEVDGDQAGEFDVLAVSGLATLGGAVALDVGYDPAGADDVVQFLTSGSRSGTFASLTGAALSGGRAFSLDYPAAAPFGARLVIDVPPAPTPGRPTISGTPASGETLTCEPGTWGGSPAFTFQWLRDGGAIGGASDETYLVADGDRGHDLSCRVTGTNASGSAQATSAAVSVPAPPAEQPAAPAPPAQTPPAPTPPPAPSPPPPPADAATPQEQQLASASPAAVAQALGLPPARVCVSRRRFTIRLREPNGVRLRSAQITVAGKRVAARRRNGRLTAMVDLRGLRKGRYTVRIVARTESGKTLTGARRYRTCATKKRRGGVREL